PIRQLLVDIVCFSFFLPIPWKMQKRQSNSSKTTELQLVFSSPEENIRINRKWLGRSGPRTCVLLNSDTDEAVIRLDSGRHDFHRPALRILSHLGMAGTLPTIKTISESSTSLFSAADFFEVPLLHELATIAQHDDWLKHAWTVTTQYNLHTSQDAYAVLSFL